MRYGLAVDLDQGVGLWRVGHGSGLTPLSSCVVPKGTPNFKTVVPSAEALGYDIAPLRGYSAAKAVNQKTDCGTTEVVP